MGRNSRNRQREWVYFFSFNSIYFVFFRLLESNKFKADFQPIINWSQLANRVKYVHAQKEKRQNQYWSLVLRTLKTKLVSHNSRLEVRDGNQWRLLNGFPKTFFLTSQRLTLRMILFLSNTFFMLGIDFYDQTSVTDKIMKRKNIKARSTFIIEGQRGPKKIIWLLPINLSFTSDRNGWTVLEKKTTINVAEECQHHVRRWIPFLIFDRDLL